MSTMQRRRQLVKTCKKYGLHVQPKTLQSMLHYNPEQEDTFDYLLPILQTLQDRLTRVSPKIITPQLWQEAVEDATASAVALSEKVVVNVQPSVRATTGPVKKTLPSRRKGKQQQRNIQHVDWKVVDAFEMPKLIYDSLRQQFHYETTVADGRPSLLGTVDDKIDMMTQRFLQAQQRVARNIPFVLTSIDRLLGTSASVTQLLLGLLHTSPNQDGFELEDLTGTIPLQLHPKSTLDHRGIYTDGCLVLVEGTYDNDIFIVNELKLPPLEPKAKTQPYLPPAPGKVSGTVGSAAPMTIYSMANVVLDDETVIQQLVDLVDNLANEDDLMQPQVVVVLMGNFTTPTLTLSSAMDELARILEPLSSNHSVLILPGPNDTPSLCWPLPPLPPQAALQPLAARVQCVSNPCRLEYDNGDQHVLLCRQDMVRQQLQHEILSVRLTTTTAETETETGTKSKPPHSVIARVWHTVLSQGHIVPRAPIYWNYDHALSVYPLPNLMVVGLEEGDETVQSFQEAECQVLAPGSAGNWAKVTLHGSSGRQKKKRRGTKQGGSSYQVEFSQTQEDGEEDEDPDDNMPADFMEEE